MPQTILITGASTGIGKATAQLFAERGWNVIATMRKPAAGAALAALPNVLVTPLDVTDPASIQAAVAAAIARFGSIDVLVNNAGFGVYGLLEVTPIETFRRQFETNVLGLLAVTQAVIPILRAKHSGVIINLSSIGGKLTMPAGTPYHGTKFAVEGISEALTYEMAQIGVKVKIVEPGAVKTDFMQSYEFVNDESLTDYQPMLKKYLSVIEPSMQAGDDPRITAEVIFTAATDGTSQLRYISGEAAKALLAKRAAEDDATFLPALQQMFSL